MSLGNTTNVKFFRIFLVLLVAAAGCAGNAVAQEAIGQDLQSIKQLTKAISHAEALLKKYPHNDFTPNLMFQLSELYLKQSALKFQREMMTYEDAEEKFRQGLLSGEPEAPRADFSQTIEVSVSLLEKFQELHFRDKVLYRVALCYSEEGNEDKAAEYFKLLSEATEDSALLEEAYFRLGEYYFERQNYSNTIDYYSRLLNGWDSPFFDMALYKLGWSYYNVQDYRKALTTFVYLIEEINLANRIDADGRGGTKADLHAEAIQYVAVCLAEFGGADRAESFLAEKKDQAYVQEVLEHLADLYRQRSFYADAVKTLELLLLFYPDKSGAAGFQKQIVDNYELAGDKAQADAGRARFLKNYGPGSMWLSGIRDGHKKQEVMAIAEEFLYTLGTETQALAQTVQDSTEYRRAINYYSSYLEKFPAFERAHKVQFYLAECYYEIADFTEAAIAYYAVLLNHPQSEFCETAAYNRILAYNRLYEANSSVDSTDLFLVNFLGKGSDTVTDVKAESPTQVQLLQASNDFFTYYASNEKSNEVLMNFAQIFYELERFDLAKQVYAEVIARPVQNPYLTQAYSLMAQSEFKVGNFEASENWYQKLATQFPDSTKLVEKANKMIASSRFRRAEISLASGDTLRAAEAFERVATTAPDRAIAERALFEAAKQYEKLQKRSKAITLYEEMFVHFPKSKLVDEALFKAGLLCEDMQSWDRAAANYLQLYRHDRFSRYAARSLFFAAKCYETDRQWNLARKYYGEYTEAYVQDADRFLEAAFRKGEVAFNLGHFQTALRDLKFVVISFRKFVNERVSVENYIPANAQFLIAEISFETFKEVKLTPPLEVKLKRKRALFQKTVKAYTAAAKFKVAEWTTASSYKIGLTFEAFGDALLESPRPENLSQQNIEKYNEKLLERVLPFKEKAQQTYAANVKTARENHITNNWVLESEKRLRALNTELGLSSLDLGEESGS